MGVETIPDPRVVSGEEARSAAEGVAGRRVDIETDAALRIAGDGHPCARRGRDGQSPARRQ